VISLGVIKRGAVILPALLVLFMPIAAIIVLGHFLGMILSVADQKAPI
jgi:hypothetical protein